MTARAFTLNPGEIAGPLQTGRGFVFETLLEKKDPYVPTLDEAKDRVRDEVIRQKALEIAKQKAAEVAAKLKGAPDFDKAAKAANVDPKATEFLSRDGARADLGATTEVIDAAFKLPAGSVSDPVATPTGAAVFKVVDKVEVSDTDVNLNKESFRDELLTNRRNMFFSAYMAKAKQKMKIQVFRDSLQRAIS
jgi:parvulin-like peptidyl-prolyl isomerase